MNTSFKTTQFYNSKLKDNQNGACLSPRCFTPSLLVSSSRLLVHLKREVSTQKTSQNREES